MTPLPFTTNSTPQATALWLAGFHRMMFQNIYTPEMLDKLGQSSVRSARENGKAGRVLYAFEQEPGLTDAVRAWDDQQRRFKAGEETFNPDDYADDGEVCVEVRRWCVGFNTRNQMANLWKTQPATLHESHGTISTREDGNGKTVTLPRMTFTSENVSAADRERLRA